VKPNIDPVEVHLQLSYNGHPVDGALVRWWVLVHCGQVYRKSLNIDTSYLPSFFFFCAGGDKPIRLARCPQKYNTMEALQNRRFWFDVYSFSTSA
jgi:hypothetical protein